MVYQTDFVCTYKLHASEDQHDMYRIQLLQAFDLIKYDDDALTKRTRAVFEQVGAHEDVQAILDKARVSPSCDSVVTLVGHDDFTMFSALFQFALFDLVHRCLCDVLSPKGRVDPVHREMLFKALE